MPIIGELLLVAGSKFIHLVRIMVPPRTKFSTRRDIFKPMVQLRPLFAYPSGPHSIDQDTLTIGIIYLIVDSLNYNFRTTHTGRLRLGAQSLSTAKPLGRATTPTPTSAKVSLVVIRITLCLTRDYQLISSLKGPDAMPLYDFRCPEGDVFEAFYPIHDKPGSVACPNCGQEATGTIPAIGPSQAKSARMQAIDATKATAEQPGVVNSVTGTRTAKRRATATTHNPLHQKLPRP